ncbi:hypothetical protein XAPC_2019 [Xanthomonas citri pv. punicae str. LMG 859]|nr:hypothetical protein XAPC_2019 [Xanthomonas citri pv. punicae str. LMG 859]
MRKGGRDIAESRHRRIITHAPMAPAACRLPEGNARRGRKRGSSSCGGMTHRCAQWPTQPPQRVCSACQSAMAPAERCIPGRGGAHLNR